MTDSFLSDMNLLSLKSSGIAPKNLSSKPTQQITQLEAEILTKGPKMRTAKNKKLPEDIKVGEYKFYAYQHQ